MLSKGMLYVFLLWDVCGFLCVAIAFNIIDIKKIGNARKVVFFLIAATHIICWLFVAPFLRYAIPAGLEDPSSWSKTGSMSLIYRSVIYGACALWTYTYIAVHWLITKLQNNR